MKILILGGTVFLGRHLVVAAQARGHEVTLFHRGRSHPELFPDVERLTGDRTHDLTALLGRSWDAVIDTCGYTPATVRRSAEALAETVGHYVFVSSISVYAEYLPAGVDEQAPLKSMTAEQLLEAEEIALGDSAHGLNFGPLYGPLKALCEQAAEEAMPGRVLQIRPGLIVGPHDYSDRFLYWVRRVAQGGEVLAPGRPQRQVRFIDVRDLAGWIVRRIEVRSIGVYNATGPARGTTMAQVLEACKAVSMSDARLTWIDERFLQEHEVGPWIELPLWLPEEYNGFFAVRNDKAITAGLTFRHLTQTVRDTLTWDRTTAGESKLKTGLDPAAEKQLLSRYATEHDPSLG